MTYQQTEKRTPEQKVRLGNVQASIWYDIRQDDNGGLREYWTTILDRTYKDASGTIKYGKTLSVHDMTDAIFVLQKAVEYIIDQQQRKRNGILAAQESQAIVVEAVVG